MSINLAAVCDDDAVVTLIAGGHAALIPADWQDAVIRLLAAWRRDVRTDEPVTLVTTSRARALIAAGRD